MTVHQKIEFVGVLARWIGQAYKARQRAADKRRAIAVWHKQPDIDEVALALAAMDDAKLTVLDARNIAAVEVAFTDKVTNVLVVNADALPIKFQTDTSHVAWPPGWFFLTSKPPEELAKAEGPWAVSFVRNVVNATLPWKNFRERPRNDFTDQLVVTLKVSGMVFDEDFLRDRLRCIDAPQVAGVVEVAAMAAAMIASAQTARRRYLVGEDILAGIGLKQNTPASMRLRATTASVVEAMRPIDGDHEEEGDHIPPTRAAQISSWGGTHNNPYPIN